MSNFTTTIPYLQSGGALIASPSSVLREQVLHRLNGRCRPVQQALGGAQALAELERGNWQVLFLDRRLPDLDVEELILIIKRRFPGIEVVLLDSDIAPPSEPDPHFSALHLSPAPQERDRTRNRDRDRANESDRANEKETGKARDADLTLAAPIEPLPGMIGTSPAMQPVYRMARLVAPRTTTVLIAGPTGSGKELVARALHALSPRASKPFVVVNCAAIPEALLESELFGYARGAFTGAVQSQLGRIPAAHGGTLFLDEIGDLPLGMQAKMLRFMEQKEVQRLGACGSTRVDVRVLAASNADLAARAARGQFREDLFYRLSAFPILLPPLSERRADIIPLAEHFLGSIAAAMITPRPRISPAAAARLENHNWNGNVRELQHVMERASILVEQGQTVESEHLYFPHLPHSTRQPQFIGQSWEESA
jgi:DNA-binding NtrC family response regulator